MYESGEQNPNPSTSDNKGSSKKSSKKEGEIEDADFEVVDWSTILKKKRSFERFFFISNSLSKFKFIL